MFVHKLLLRSDCLCNIHTCFFMEGDYPGILPPAWLPVQSKVVPLSRGYFCMKPVYNQLCTSDSFHLGAKAFGSDTFGQGNTTIRSTNFDCQGTETSLEDCSHDVGKYYSVECGHQQDAGVACFPCYREGAIQIANSSSDVEGQIEICHNYQWVAVCVQFWNESEAVVACHELGLPTIGE